MDGDRLFVKCLIDLLEQIFVFAQSIEGCPHEEYFVVMQPSKGLNYVIFTM